MTDFDPIGDDPKEFEAQELVRQTKDPDDLVHLIVETKLHWMTRDDAAAKLIRMWEEGRVDGITLDHIAYVGDHACERHKSKANQIISDNI